MDISKVIYLPTKREKMQGDARTAAKLALKNN